ncbi:MAG: DUF3489 domain-containing protein [Afipia sp.]
MSKTAKARPFPRAHRRATAEAATKRSRIVAMLNAPVGASIEAMMKATGWQQHSVRGFLAGVLRKKLHLNLVSEVGPSGRIYRIAKSAKRKASQS